MKRSQIVTTASRTGQTWAGIPGVEITPGGRLFVAWYSGGEKEPDPENTIYLCTSSDRGATFTPSETLDFPRDRGVTFTPPEILAVPRDGARAYDPTLWLAPTGALWLIFNRGNQDTAQHGIFARICAQPDAATPLWGDEFRLGYAVPFSFRMNKPTVLSSGEWLMPVTHSPKPVYGWSAGSFQFQSAGISTNQGQTWQLYGAVDAPSWALENSIVECRDGTLVMYIRTGAGVIWQSRSSDCGRSWSAGEPTAIPNPGSRFYIRLLSDGDWLLINSPDPTRRTGIAASLSSDEGRTWHGKLVLDPRDNVSYPDAALAADGTIYAVHDRERYGAAEILLSEFKKEDVR